MDNQEMINEEGPGRKIWRYIYPVLTYLAFLYLVQFAYAAFYTIKITGGMDLASIESATIELRRQLVNELLIRSNELQALGAFLCLPVLYTYYKWDRRRDARHGRIQRFEKISPVKFVFAAFLGITACFAGNNLLILSGITEMSEAYAEVTEYFYQGSVLVEAIGLGIIVPIAEEMIFRGLIYRRLKESFPIKVAAVILSLMFAFFHGNIVQGIYAFFLSLLLVYVYERFHHMLAPILFHAAANTLSVFISELGILDWTYESAQLVWTSTLVYCVLVVIAVALIEYLVVSKEITE